MLSVTVVSLEILAETFCYCRTDETKIELFGHNYRNHVWRKDGEPYTPENTAPTVKFSGGSIMIWGWFSAKGVGKISVIDGTMNSQKYKQILQENLKSSV